MFTFPNGVLFTRTYVWQANGVIEGGEMKKSTQNKSVYCIQLTHFPDFKDFQGPVGTVEAIQ